MKFSVLNLDRRIIYLFVLLALSLPLIYGVSVQPARMKSAEKLYNLVDHLEVLPGDIAWVAMDFGPSTNAENGPQAEVIIEHLMRRRIPFVVFSQYVQAEPFLRTIPERIAERLNKEDPTQNWVYGRDWVNIGYRIGGFLQIQSIAKSKNLPVDLGEDVRGDALSSLPIFRNTKDLRNIKLLVEFTGLVGVFNSYIQFFQREDYRPKFGHGCTSITIPEAFIYLDSGQLSGLLEGIAGAAWYSKLLSDAYPKRELDAAILTNTGLGVAHLVVILLIVAGNISMFLGAPKLSRAEGAGA